MNFAEYNKSKLAHNIVTVSAIIGIIQILFLREEKWLLGIIVFLSIIAIGIKISEGEEERKRLKP